MLTKIKARWRGFVPNFYAHSLDLCAYYHCKREREASRRWCKEHAAQYDCEALEGENRIIPIRANMSLLDYFYDREDISALSIYEAELFIGESVKCSQCKRTAHMGIDQEFGVCPFCGVYISKSQRRKLENLIKGNMPLMWP